MVTGFFLLTLIGALIAAITILGVQTQSPTYRQSEGETIDYTPGSAVYAGDVILIGSMVCVAGQDIDASAKGSLATKGVFLAAKDTSTFTAGDPIYWNPTGDPVGGTAGVGAFTSTAVGTYFAGTCVLAAATGDATVPLKLNGQTSSAATVGQGRDPVNTAISTAGAGTLTAAGIVGGVITRTGPVAAYTDTTATALQIIAAIPGSADGEAWLLYIKNTVPFTSTLAAGTGVTLSGQGLIPANSVGVFLITRTSSTAVAMRGIGIIPMTTNPLLVNTADTTVGAATLTAAAIAGGLITRSGSVAAYTDTTATADLIIAAKPNVNIGDSWLLEIKNTVNFNETLAGGTGVTVSGITIVPPLSVGRFLVTYTAASTLTVVGIGSYPLCNLPPSKYTTGALQSATFVAGDITGAGVVMYDNTGTTPGNLTTRTAAEMFGDIPNCQIGFSYTLLVRNSSGSANTATIVAGSNVTVTGTMTIAQTVTRVFNVKFPTATTCTIQSMGILAAGA